MIVYKCEVCQSHLFLNSSSHLRMHKKSRKHREALAHQIKQFILDASSVKFVQNRTCKPVDTVDVNL